jgi:helicase SWR1
MAPVIDRFAVITPNATTQDLAGISLPSLVPTEHPELMDVDFDTLHRATVKLQIAFPDASLLQYDCGKLQVLHDMLKELKAGGHRVIIFTQMTKMLDILELFLSYNGHRYFRLDGGTKIEDRQRITERFNSDERIFAFIASTRAGGVGIK